MYGQVVGEEKDEGLERECSYLGSKRKKVAPVSCYKKTGVRQVEDWLLMTLSFNYSPRESTIWVL